LLDLFHLLFYVDQVEIGLSVVSVEVDDVFFYRVLHECCNCSELARTTIRLFKLCILLQINPFTPFGDRIFDSCPQKLPEILLLDMIQIVLLDMYSINKLVLQLIIRDKSKFIIKFKCHLQLLFLFHLVTFCFLIGL
jgi:hypothetical protein